MLDFLYYTPTKVAFGKDALLQTGALIKEQGCKKVLIHYGGGSAVRSGLIAKVEAVLKDAGIDYVTLGGVKPNPRLSLVREGMELCKKEGVDFLLAVGGGSVIDSAKAMGYGLTNDCDVWDIYLKKVPPKACMPVGCILTIAAAGSEMSDSSVITNEDGGIKRGVSSNYARCKFAVMDPTLTYTLPAYQTMCGCTDIMMHTMERYFSMESMSLTDSIAEGLLREIVKDSVIVRDDPENYEARANIMWAGSLSHNGLTGCGHVGDFATHQIGHELSGMFDVAHGASLAAVWSSWARYVMDAKPERFAQFAVNAMGVKPTGDAVADAEAGIKAWEDLMVSIGMPIRVKDMDIELTDEQIEELAEKCSFRQTRTIGGFKKLDKADILEIYKMAR